jgi:hypothetical protein
VVEGGPVVVVEGGPLVVVGTLEVVGILEVVGGLVVVPESISDDSGVVLAVGRPQLTCRSGRRRPVHDPVGDGSTIDVQITVQFRTLTTCHYPRYTRASSLAAMAL